MSNVSSCIQTIRRNISIIRRTQSEAATQHEDQDYLQAVAESIADAGAVLITGPANAKTELIKHIRQHNPQQMKAIAGVEAVDHPSDAALVSYAKTYFKAADRMRPQ